MLKASDWNQNKFMNRFAVLAVSLVITTGTSIAPALPEMQKSFPSVPSSMINLIATIQQIPAFIVLLFSASIAARFGVKKMIGLGMLLMGIFGILPAILNNIWLILGSRIIFGIGIGLFNSLAITIITILYSGDDRAQMLGKRNAFEPIGLCIMNIMIGILLNISWQVSFLAYGLILLVLVFFWKMVPDIQIHADTDKETKNDKPKETVNFPVIISCLFLIIMTIGQTIVNVITPSIIVNHGFGSATVSSIVISINAVAGMAMGFLFGQVFSRIRQYVLPLGLLALMLGAMLINYAGQLWMVVLGVIIAGFSYPLSGTFVFAKAQDLAPKGSRALANSVLLVGCNVGTAITPFVMSALDPISPWGGNESGLMSFAIFVAIIMICIFGYQILHIRKSN